VPSIAGATAPHGGKSQGLDVAGERLFPAPRVHMLVLAHFPYGAPLKAGPRCVTPRGAGGRTVCCHPAQSHSPSDDMRQRSHDLARLRPIPSAPDHAFSPPSVGDSFRWSSSTVCGVKASDIRETGVVAHQGGLGAAHRCISDKIGGGTPTTLRRVADDREAAAG
jgi:hypothetical protein